MFFQTRDECLHFAGCSASDLWKRGQSPAGFKVADGITVFYENHPALFAFAGDVAHWLHGFDHCALLMDEFGIWPSSENLHLYYRLRNSYGDMRMLFDAPGHAFLKHETADLTTFLELAFRFGWGGYIFPQPNNTKIRFSHDGWLTIFTTETREQVLKDAEHRKLVHRFGEAG